MHRNGPRYANGQFVRATAWMITIWGAEAPWDPDAPLPPGVVGLIGQLEHSPNAAPDNQFGGYHWQLYLETEDRMSWPMLRDLMGWNDRAAHADQRRGSRRQAIDYVTKDATRVREDTNPLGPNAITHIDEREAGVVRHEGNPGADDGWRAQPAPQAMEAAIEDLRAGMKADDAAKKHSSIFARYPTGMNKLAATFDDPPKWRHLQVYFYHGDPGTGKSRLAHQQTGGEAYVKLDGKWWDGYESQDALIFDDFDGHKSYSIAEMLRWLDGYKMQVNIRNGTRWARWTKVYITTNLEFEELYPLATNKQRAALARRIPLANRRRFTEGDEIVFSDNDSQADPIPPPL